MPPSPVGPAVAPRQVRIAFIKGQYKDKDRPSIVVRVEPDRALVLYGQGEDDGREALRVQVASSIGKSFGIDKDTNFREGNLQWVKLSQVKRLIGRCPPTPFLQATAYADAFVASHFAQQVKRKEATHAETDSDVIASMTSVFAGDGGAPATAGTARPPSQPAPPATERVELKGTT